MGLRHRLSGLFFPDRCVICSKVVVRDNLCCERCSALQFQGQDVFYTPREYPERCMSAFDYRGSAGNAVKRMKFQGDLRAAEYFAQRMAKILEEQFPTLPWELITYVPMTEQRQKERGYNQAQVLADLISEQIGIPVQDELLLRTGSSAQHRMSAALRRWNAVESYGAYPGASLSGERILLIDDVLTTGSTAGACARILQQLGAGKVTVMTAAR